MHVNGIHTVAVPVADQDRALAFYCGTLGCETRMDAPFGDGRWIEVAPPGSATTIALVPSPSPGVDTGIRLTTADADADQAELRAAGVDADDVMRMGHGVPPMFPFRDPDGNRLVMIEL